MVSATVGGITTNLSYDPYGRLWDVNGSTDTRYVSDGTNIATIYNGTTYNADWMFGPDENEPITTVTTGTTPSSWLHSDERGSIIATTDGSGNNNLIQSYDEYGVPGTTNSTTFQYTGQLYLPQLKMSYFNARMYWQTLGRFMQTDPIGTNGGINLYNYTGNDPVNAIDPAGLAGAVPGSTTTCSGPNEYFDTDTQTCGILVRGYNPYSLPGRIAWGNPQQPGSRTTPGRDGRGRGSPPIFVCNVPGASKCAAPYKRNSQKGFQQCLTAEFSTKAFASLIVDGGSLAFSIAFPQARLAQIAIAGASVAFAGYATGGARDLPAFGNNIIGYHFTAFGAEAARQGGLFNSIVKAGSNFTGGISVLIDLNNIRRDIAECMSIH